MYGLFEFSMRFSSHASVQRPFFDPHPHAGFCPITYVLEDSEGTISNRDTINEQITTSIGPGDLFFNTAGSGMMHEENPPETGKNVHGLQIFINLAAKNKGTKPKHNHLKLSSASPNRFYAMPDRLTYSNSFRNTFGGRGDGSSRQSRSW
jgi:redox-sensitive bicupin YhaK (pirin superfamily)